MVLGLAIAASDCDLRFFAAGGDGGGDRLLYAPSRLGLISDLTRPLLAFGGDENISMTLGSEPTSLGAGTLRVS